MIVWRPSEKIAVLYERQQRLSQGIILGLVDADSGQRKISRIQLKINRIMRKGMR